MRILEIDQAEALKDAGGFWIIRGRMRGSSTMIITSPIKEVPSIWVDGLYETVHGTKLNVEFVQRN